MPFRRSPAELEDLIRYENESTGVDFKATQYRKDAFAELLRDVIAMANANVAGPRYLILGVKLRPGGDRDILGVAPDNFVDSATYQQLIHNNVEPELSIEYAPFQIDALQVGVLEIAECDDPPYMMRKDFSPLQRGECWVRKGTQRVRFARPDFDRIVARIGERGGFTGALRITFEGSSSTSIQLPSVGQHPLPSARAAERIRGVLARRQLPGTFGDIHRLLSATGSTYGILGRPVPYESRSTEQLEKNLSEVRKDYAEADKYELCELRAAKVNLEILNESDAYLEDATVELEFPALDGLQVVDEPAHKPYQASYFGIPEYHARDPRRYPTVEVRGSTIVASESVGDLKHWIVTRVFELPLRLVIATRLEGETIRVRSRVFGKNVRTPILTEMSIKVVPRDDDDFSGDDELA